MREYVVQKYHLIFYTDTVIFFPVVIYLFIFINYPARILKLLILIVIKGETKPT